MLTKHFRWWCKCHASHHGNPIRFHWLRIGSLAILLEKDKEPFIMSQLHIDQTVSISIVATDVAGNTVAFTPDAPPIWTNSNPAAATDAVSADGLSDVLTPVAVGLTTSVGVSVVIGGVTFTATIDEAVVEGAIAGIKLVETFSPKP